MSIRRRLTRNPKPPQERPIRLGHCDECGIEFEDRSRNQSRRWCSHRCNMRHNRKGLGVREFVCRYCGTAFTSGTAGQKRCDACRAGAGVCGPPQPCLGCGEMYLPKKGNHGYCSIGCAVRDREPVEILNPTGKGHKQRAIRFGVEYEVVDRQAVFERDGWFCGICQTPVDPRLAYPHPRSASLDHVVPLSRGGDHAYLNVWCAHLDCNIAKGSRLHAGA